MPRQNDVLVTIPMDILPRQSFQVVGHVFEEQDLVASRGLNGLQRL